MKAVVYLRVSTKEQAQNLSLPTQRRACDEYCRREGLDVVKVFEDAGESAKTTDRPEFQQLIRYATTRKNGIKVVVIYNMTRFSRNSEDFYAVNALLASHGVLLRSATELIGEDPAGKFMAGMLTLVGQFENDAKAVRTREGMKAALERGRWVWRAPIGYQTGRRTAGQPSLVADSERAASVRLAFELIASGIANEAEALRRVAAAGLRTRAGEPIGRQTFRTLIRNPIYKGIMDAPEFGLRAVRGDFEPIVPAALFDRVQARLNGRNGVQRRDLLHSKFPLRRFVVCAVCDTPLTGSDAGGRSRKYPYYHCRRCRGVRIPTAALETQFVSVLESVQPEPGVMPLFNAIVKDVWNRQQAAAAHERRILEGRLVDLERRETALDDAFIHERRIDERTYERGRDRIRVDIGRVQTELAGFGDEQDDLDGVLAFAGHVVENAASIWMDAAPAHRQKLQRAIFPDGLRLRDGKFETARTSFAFNQLQTFAASGASLASPPGIEPGSRP